jgi:hypothetical protein
VSVLWLLACGGAPAPCLSGFEHDDSGACVPIETTDTDGDGGGWDSPELPEAPWSELALEGVLDELLADGLPDQFALKDLFQAMLGEGRDETCPNDDGTEIFAMLTDSCTSDKGYRFYGIAALLEAVKDSDDPEPNAADYVFSMAPASYEITDPGGDTHYAGGAFFYQARLDGDSVDWFGETNGSFGYPQADGLIRGGYSASLTSSGRYGPDGDSVSLLGSLSLNGISAFIDELVWDTETCGGVAAGSVQIRTQDGYWYQATFGANCEPCGPLTYAGEPFGELCYDWSGTLEGFAAAMVLL